MERRAARGKPTPAIDNRPQLFPDLVPVWEAYNALQGSRSYIGGFSVSPGPIPFEAVDRWARRFGPEDPEDFREFWLMIRALDEVYLEWAGKEQAKKGKRR